MLYSRNPYLPLEPVREVLGNNGTGSVDSVSGPLFIGGFLVVAGIGVYLNYLIIKGIFFNK